MTDNTTFPSPNPTLATFQADIAAEHAARLAESLREGRERVAMLGERGRVARCKWGCPTDARRVPRNARCIAQNSHSIPRNWQSIATNR